MLTINCICVGKLKERYWTQACEEYQKRLGAFCKFRIIEVAEHKLPEQPSETQIQQALKAEGEKILQWAAGSTLIPLCIEGKQIDSPALAQHLGTLALNGVSAVSFVIGSSHGLCDKVKQSGTLQLSMSRMTFPHQLARVMLCEQIYRAFQIQNHGRYHK